VSYLSTGLQGVQWVRELVVVRVSWPGHPGLQKKQKKNVYSQTSITPTIKGILYKQYGQGISHGRIERGQISLLTF
jgi:hypothetical protein